jgi:hypothetical protein
MPETATSTPLWSTRGGNEERLDGLKLSLEQYASSFRYRFFVAGAAEQNQKAETDLISQIIQGWSRGYPGQRMNSALCSTISLQNI